MAPPGVGGSRIAAAAGEVKGGGRRVLRRSCLVGEVKVAYGRAEAFPRGYRGTEEDNKGMGGDK